MTKKVIPPIWMDFQTLITDEFCPYCNGKLEKYTLKDGTIIYLCYKCDTVWEKNIIDKNHFELVESKEGLVIC